MRNQLQAFRSSWASLTAPFRENRLVRWVGIAVLLVVLILLPYTMATAGSTIDFATTAGAYVVMALGLNIVVGFAGLLDLGYVAFYALGALTMGWLGSAFAFNVNHNKGIHIGVSSQLSHVPGIHLNFLLILLASVIVCGIAGMLI